LTERYWKYKQDVINQARQIERNDQHSVR
jgi:hypothetical protein